jgi:hypothetical protein
VVGDHRTVYKPSECKLKGRASERYSNAAVWQHFQSQRDNEDRAGSCEYEDLSSI